MKSILITSSILIVLVAALRPLLRGRIDPRVQYALWLIIALRLLVPVELAPSAYSALALLERAQEPARVVEAIGRTAVPVQSYDAAHAQVIEEYRRQGVDTADLTPRDLMDIDTQARALTRGPTLAELAAKYARPVWLGGAAVMAAWFLLVNARLRRKLGRAELIEIEQSCGLPVFVSDALPSPCLCGALRPAVYVTPAAAGDANRMRHVLAHETTHYRHRDHWWALVRCLCLCLYWFNPLVWWAAALSRQDCELACDAGAIRRLGEAERLPYGRTLVDMIAAGRCSLMQTATTMTGGKRRVRQRVRLIARRPKTVLAVVLALVLVLGAAVGCTFTGAPEKEPAQLSDAGPSPLAADTLPARLLDVPEDLQADVAALSGNEPTETLNSDFTALAQYWMNRDWADYDGIGMGWLLTVYQWDQEQFEQYYPDLEVTGGVDCFAKDDHFYYVIFRATDARVPMSETGYMDAFEAVRAYAMEQVLATQGVEPYAGQGTLRARLNNVPLDLQADVVTGPGHDDSPTLVTYWMNRDWTNKDDSGLGFLLRVDEMSQAELDEYRNTGGSEVFARSGGTYYAILYATDVRYYSPDDAEPFHNAFDAIRAYAMEQVLSTDGVEPFTPDSQSAPDPAMPSYIDGLDYTLVTSHEDVPEDPEQWYLVGQMPGYPLWMFTRDRGQETMFQAGDQLTQVFPYTARRFGGGQTHDGHAPQLMTLEGFGWGPKGTFGPFAVITHVFQGGTDQQYQLTVYDLGTDPAATTAYVHDWEPLMEDFNQNCAVTLDETRHTATLSYEGQSAEIQFDGIHWDNVRQYGFAAKTDEYCMKYFFNKTDQYFDLAMPVNPFTTDQVAIWTLRFTGDGFETIGFRFVQSDDAYTFISSATR